MEQAQQIGGIEMKNKIKELFGYALGVFLGTNIIMIWLQGGGRHSYNAKANLKACLIVSVPITLVVIGLFVVDIVKKHKEEIMKKNSQETIRKIREKHHSKNE